MDVSLDVWNRLLKRIFSFCVFNDQDLSITLPATQCLKKIVSSMKTMVSFSFIMLEYFKKNTYQCF